MKCQAFVSQRAYSHPGQCESVSRVKETVFRGKKVRGLCTRHRRSDVINKIKLITDPSLEFNQTRQGAYERTKISSVPTLQIKQHRAQGRIRSVSSV